MKKMLLNIMLLITITNLHEAQAVIISAPDKHLQGLQQELNNIDEQLNNLGIYRTNRYGQLLSARKQQIEQNIKELQEKAAACNGANQQAMPAQQTQAQPTSTVAAYAAPAQNPAPARAANLDAQQSAFQAFLMMRQFTCNNQNVSTIGSISAIPNQQGQPGGLTLNHNGNSGSK